MPLQDANPTPSFGGFGLTLSAAACIAGTDQDNIKSLPNTAGMKNEFVIQKRHRYAFDPLYTVSGGELVEAGDSDGCTSEQLDGAIGPRTAAVVYQVRPSWGDALVSLRDAVDIAHRRGVPVVADAASQVYPLDYMLGNARAADLVCFGGKYIRSETDTGFICGKADYIEAVKANGFIPFGPVRRVVMDSEGA